MTFHLTLSQPSQLNTFFNLRVFLAFYLLQNYNLYVFTKLSENNHKRMRRLSGEANSAKKYICKAVALLMFLSFFCFSLLKQTTVGGQTNSALFERFSW